MHCSHAIVRFQRTLTFSVGNQLDNHQEHICPVVPTRRTEVGPLVFDEYSTNVDIATERLMQQQRDAIVMVGHHLEILVESDKVVMLDTDSGRIVKDRASKELVEKLKVALNNISGRRRTPSKCICLPVI